MSKSISFGFGKPKISSGTTSTAPSNTKNPKQINGSLKPKKALLSEDNLDQDEDGPKHEEVSGFSTGGAILTEPKPESSNLVIENAGNGNWMTRNRRERDAARQNGQAAQAQHDQAHEEVQVLVENSQVSRASGLQFAGPAAALPAVQTSTTAAAKDGHPSLLQSAAVPASSSKDIHISTDNAALSALLGRATSTSNSGPGQPDIPILPTTDDAAYNADISTLPEAPTQEDYASMPIENFGLAMLKGMGRKRRANGEVIDIDEMRGKEEKERQLKRRKLNEGFLGIGAKPVLTASTSTSRGAAGGKGSGDRELNLGAWGKEDMRKAARGAGKDGAAEGFFTPVVLKNVRTGEIVTEEEVQRRKEAVLEGERQAEEEVQKRIKGSDRDRNRRDKAERSDRDSDRDSHRDRKRRIENGDDDGRSHADSNRSRRRSKSPGRSKRHRDDDRYDSGSGLSRHHKDRYDKDRDGDRDKYRDRDRDRDRNRERDRDRNRR